MKKRLLTASVLLLILGGVFALRLINLYGLYLFDLFIGIIAIFSAMEFAKLLSQMGAPISHMAAGIYPSLMFAGHMFYFLFNLDIAFYAVIQLSLLIFSFLVIFIIYSFLNTKGVVKYRKEHGLSKAKCGIRFALKTFLTFIYPTFLLLALMLLNRIDYLSIPGINFFAGNFGWIALITAFLIPVITDSAAMLFGMAIKGPKLCPKISPKKTIAGAICGVIFSGVILGAFYYVFNAFPIINSGFLALNIKPYHFVILGTLGSIISQIGDVFESYLKRKADVKDSGSAFPGHGGFLDRLDSHIFSGPFVLLFLTLLIML